MLHLNQLLLLVLLLCQLTQQSLLYYYVISVATLGIPYRCITSDGHDEQYSFYCFPVLDPIQNWRFHLQHYIRSFPRRFELWRNSNFPCSIYFQNHISDLISSVIDVNIIIFLLSHLRRLDVCSGQRMTSTNVSRKFFTYSEISPFSAIFNPRTKSIGWTFSLPKSITFGVKPVCLFSVDLMAPVNCCK